MYDDDTSTADTNALSAATANLYRLILSHLEDVAELSGETSILLGRLQHYISRNRSASSVSCLSPDFVASYVCGADDGT